MITRAAASLPLDLSTTIVREPLIVPPEMAVMTVVAKMLELQEEADTVGGTGNGVDSCFADRTSCVVVMDAGQVLGLLTERDLLRPVARNISLEDIAIHEIVASPLVTIRESVLTDLEEVLKLLQQNTHHWVVVDEQEQLVGIIFRHVLRQLLKIQILAAKPSKEPRKKQSVGLRAQRDNQTHKSMLRAAPVGICRKGIQGNITYSNDCCREILALSCEALSNLEWRRRIHSADRVRVLEAQKEIESPYQIEYRFQRPDGDTIWLQEQSIIERNDKGDVIGSISTITDVSDRKCTEATLIQSELSKQAILSAIPDYLFRVDSNGIYQEVIAHKPEITLFPANLDPVGQSMMEILPEEVALRQHFYLAETLRTGELRTYEQQIQIGDWLRDEEIRVVKSGEDEALFMIRDISDRKQAERQLQSLIEGTANTTGQDFFPALVRHIAAALSVSHAIVTELVGNELHSLAFWANGALHSPISYNLLNTPCEHTLRDGVFYCERSLQQRFPEDLDVANMQVDSYLGIALYDSQGRVIGDLCILDPHPIPSPQRAQKILQAFAARATAELERQRAQASLKELNQALEAKVTERTAELLEREQFLQTVLDTFPLSVFWKDVNSAYLGCNQNCLKNAGLKSIADIIGKTDHDMPWEKTCGDQAQLDDRQVMQSNTAKLGIEETLAKADGQQIWVETNKLPLRNLSGEVIGVLGTFQDITVRKRLELDLQKSKKELSEVLDSAIAGIVRFRLYPDTSLQYDYISPHCADAIGYTVEELLSGQDYCRATIEPDDWPTAIAPMIEAILNDKGTSTYQTEYRLRHKNGSIFWVLANCFAQWNEAGGYWDVTKVETDISDRKRAELQLQNLIAGTAATTGQDFFPALAKYIAEALSVSHVFVSECKHHELHILSAWADGGELQPDSGIQLNESYAWGNTPCERTIQEGIFHCDRNVQQRFPQYQILSDMGVESYLGIALQDTKENVTGVLCILHYQPLEDVQRAIQILQVFAARAAAELERQRANIALEQLNQALESKVVERTAKLQEQEQFLRTVLDTFPLDIFWKDRDSVYLGGNRNFLAKAGLASLAEIKGKTDYELPWTLEEAESYRANDRLVIDSNTPKLGNSATQCNADGSQIWIETNKLPLHNLEGEVIGVLGTSQDITEQKMAAATIKQQLAAIEAAIDGIGILENDVYIYVNQAHLNLFGYSQPEDLLGRSWQVLYSDSEIQRFEQEILPVLERDHAWQGEAIATRKDGSTCTQGVSLTLMDNGLVICVCRDISDLKLAQAQISHNALHDPLTGLPNRRLLLEQLERVLNRAQRFNNYHYAVLFLDLDRFKVINDSLGHLVGDKLLIEVANRLKHHLRSTDMVARLGGDEFVIVLEDIITVEAIVHIAERILADCQIPITIDEHKIFTSTSIGIAIGNEHYHDPSNLIRDADIAMYRAKAQENNSYKFFDAAMYAEAMSRLTLETDLRKALNQQELTLYYQPIVHITKQQLVGFEALVRWHHPSRGLIFPSEFMPIAEETGLVIPMDTWVIHQACAQMLQWQNQFAQQLPLKISINLSAQDLGKTTFLQDIDHILSLMDGRGNLINLEITESMLINDIDHTIELLNQLATRQIQISIDDFGTGYSSFSYLNRLPIHSLKIDRSFVGGMHLDNRNYQVVSTILALGKQLGLTVIAEGIETSQHLQQLQALGCDLGQGYFFARPLTTSEVETMLADISTVVDDSTGLRL